MKNGVPLPASWFFIAVRPLKKTPFFWLPLGILIFITILELLLSSPDIIPHCVCDVVHCILIKTWKGNLMVLILYGNSGIGAHVWSNLCWRHLIRTRAVTNTFFCTCATCFELPTNISNMGNFDYNNHFHFVLWICLGSSCSSTYFFEGKEDGINTLLTELQYE